MRKARMASSRSPPIRIFLPREKSVLNCDGPFMILWPAVPYAVDPSGPTAIAGQIAALLIQLFSRAVVPPGVTRLAYVELGHRVMVEVAALPYTLPPLGSV